MRFIDLFAGVGGFHLGLEKTTDRYKEGTKHYESERDLQNFKSGTGKWKHSFRCVWANEWDKYAGQVYKKRFPNTPFFEGDIREVKAKDIPDHDLLCGGFPCQAFSTAGKRRGFEETRGTLFFEIARIAREKQPSLLLLENVKGLLSHDKGRTFATVLRTLDEIGYDAEWEVLNSKNFGVPQNRERVFIIGHSRKGSCGQIFPLGQTSEEPEQRFSETEVASSLQHPGHSGGNYRGMNMISKTIKKGGRGSLKENGEPMFTLTGQDIHGVQQENRIRRLTPKECERLQGFPDGWTLIEKLDGKSMSDTQRYKMMGNAVTVNVVQTIGEKLKEALK